MFGFMVTTAFLSMWLANTATAAMMVPIAHAVILELEGNRKRKRQTSENYPNLGPGAPCIKVCMFVLNCFSSLSS